MHPDNDLDPSKLKKPKGRKREYDLLRLLAAIEDTSESNPISTTAWAEAVGIKRQTLSGYLPEMHGKGWIGTSGEGTQPPSSVSKSAKWSMPPPLSEMSSTARPPQAVGYSPSSSE